MSNDLRYCEKYEIIVRGGRVTTNDGGGTRSSRERALAAAERRRAIDRCQEKNEER